MVHVLCVAGAAIGIAFADLSLFRDEGVDRALLRLGSRLVAICLALLWLSGLAIIWIDTGFDMAVILARPKLVAKVAVALLLSLNGFLLHRWFFRSLATPPANLRHAVNAAAAMAAVSGASWLYAGFLGMAKPLAPLVTLAGFAAMFLGVLAVSGLFVARLVRPRMLRLYQQGN